VAAQPTDSTAHIPTDPDTRPLALFDLDGTLTDPADGILSCHRFALEAFGFPWNDDIDPRALIGPPVEESHTLLGVPADAVDRTAAKYRERFAVAGWLDDAPYDGIADLLDSLRTAGWTLGVATMKLEPFAVRILERVGFAEHFDVVAGSDVQRTRRTKRAIIEHAVSQLDRPPAGTAMIGDRRHDVEAALSLSMTAIGVTWGFGSIEELMTANAHHIAMNPADIAEALLG